MYILPYLLLQRLYRAAIGARRQNRTRSYVVWSAIAALSSVVMVALAIAFALLLFQASLVWLAMLILGVMGGPPIADQLARYVFVPLGWHRVAYTAAVVGRTGADPNAYGLCIAARASRSGSAIAWVVAQRDTRKPLGDGEVAVTALLAANRGDAETARLLLRSIAMLVEDHPSVRELAGEWLACDAAERGAWSELVDDAAHNRWPPTPLTYLLEGIAARRAGAAHAPGPRELWLRWLIAPRHRVTLPLVREALAIAPSTPAAPGIPPASEPASESALASAVSAHLAFEAQPATAAALATTVRAWDLALDDAATRDWLARRALELDAPAGAVERAIREVAGSVTEELARRAEAAKLGAPAGVAGAVGADLARRLRHGRLDALEAGFTRWADRRHDSALRSAIDEWREFIALWTAYNAAVSAGGIELRRLAFPHAFSKGNHMAAWLWNKREEYALSHAISKWLLSEALLVGDTEAIELGHRNCSLDVPTRLGRYHPTAPSA